MGGLITVKNLHKWFGKLHVLKGVNLTVNKGEVVVLIGPSGSGKSTLLKCIIGLVKPDLGEVYVDGIKLEYDNEEKLIEVRKRVGMVFQSFNLFYHLNVLQNIMLPLTKVHKIPKEKAYEIAMKVLREVGLEDKAYCYPAELSGGQQQRVAIARALAINPKVLLMDEPTSALDPSLVDEVLNTIKRVIRRNIATLIVTHEIDFAEEIAHRIVVMNDGKIIEEGPPHEILYNPKEPQTRRLLERVLRKRLSVNRF